MKDSSLKRERAGRAPSRLLASLPPSYPRRYRGFDVARLRPVPRTHAAPISSASGRNPRHSPAKTASPGPFEGLGVDIGTSMADSGTGRADRGEPVVSIQRGTQLPQGPGRTADKLLIALFLAAIVVPLLDGWLRPSSERTFVAEHRRPNPKPVLKLDLATLTDYPRKFNAWYGDTFGLRDKLVRLHNEFKWFVLGVSPTSTLVLGEGDWVEFTWFNTIPVYRGVAGFEERELEDWRALLEYRRDWLAKRGIAYLFAIA